MTRVTSADGVPEREKVYYIEPDPNGPHTYIWPYDTMLGKILCAYQADINLLVSPPLVKVIFIDVSEERKIRPALSSEATQLAEHIEVDFGPQAIGLVELHEYIAKLS